MAKYTKEIEMYGELTNIGDKPTYLDRIIANYKREYSKAFQVFNLTQEHLNAEFVWNCPWTKKHPLRPYQVIGQLTQDVLIVKRTDTNRYYRFPTREVAKAFEANLQLDGDI